MDSMTANLIPVSSYKHMEIFVYFYNSSCLPIILQKKKGPPMQVSQFFISIMELQPMYFSHKKREP